LIFCCFLSKNALAEKSVHFVLFRISPVWFAPSKNVIFFFKKCLLCKQKVVTLQAETIKILFVV